MTSVATGSSPARDWWLRTLLVLQRPRPVFVALRDDSKEAVSDRGEQVLALILLSGIAYALATPTAGTLMDPSSDPNANYDGLLVAIWAFIAGGIVGTVAYWLIGLLLHLGGRLLGSQGSYRRARHVLAFASAPIALSLVLLPVRLSLYGSDIFRSGGSDSGRAAWVWASLQLAFLLWALALLLIGIRSVHGWAWPRALATVGAAVGVAVAFSVAIVAVSRVL